MRLIVITANLMQRLAGLPATPDITLLDLRKPKPHPRSHTNTTFRELTYIRWCCIDLSNAPPLSFTTWLGKLQEVCGHLSEMTTICPSGFPMRNASNRIPRP